MHPTPHSSKITLKYFNYNGHCGLSHNLLSNEEKKLHCFIAWLANYTVDIKKLLSEHKAIVRKQFSLSYFEFWDKGGITI